MAEFKQYINQKQENGTVMISEDVVSAIAEHALTDVDGVSGLSAKPGSDIVDILGVNWGKGIRILIAEDNALRIHCNIIVAYGYSVSDVAAAAQTAVASAVESMTGVKVSSVDVNVCGIARGME